MAHPYGSLPDAAKYTVPEIDAKPSRLQHTPTGSSVLEEGSVQEHGRTYHWYKDGLRSYIFPNDGEEQNRLDIQHKVALLLMDGHLAWAPVNPRRVLDLGTGTGIWAIQFAQQNPDAIVVGTDLSAIQPQGVTSNCEFIREDADDEWTLGGTFDYVHFRFFCAFTTNLKMLLRRIYDHLEPGGWLEAQETTYGGTAADGSYHGSAIETAVEATVQAMAAAGQNPWAMTILKDLFIDAGFVDVVEHIQPQPCGDWAVEPKYKEVGRWHAINAVAGVGGLARPIMRAKEGITAEEAQSMVERAQDEILSGQIPVYSLFYVVYGRKPLP